MKSTLLIAIASAVFLFSVSCKQSTDKAGSENNKSATSGNTGTIEVEAENFSASSDDVSISVEDNSYVLMASSGWISLDVQVSRAGRYKSIIHASADNDTSTVWVEDYIDNPDGRTYNITGSIPIGNSGEFDEFYVDGTPLKDTLHRMKLHVYGSNVKVDKIVFKLIREHAKTPTTYTQSTDGDNWELVWSDEFDGQSLDTSKWTYDIGNWGWGNNELQYYTAGREENARLSNGILVIEARKNDMGQAWTSARLTTRGKESFLYGKIEFKARVPREKGNWAAGWTLGDTYVDEHSWPYCGEIDIMESVGYEVDNASGDGIAHCTVHTPAYYFKINNQISSTREIKNIAGEFHTYSVEWTPSEIRGYVDGEHYYTYDKNADAKEWPFNIPQNIILNLAMGGGWGGAQGMDTSVTSQILEVDYVRVYQSN